MEYLAFVYTLLLVAICLMMAVLLARTSRLLKEPKDDEALKSWLEQQLAAQAKDFSARQDAVAQQNYAAIRSVSETLQTAVQGMSTTLGQGQDSQQRKRAVFVVVSVQRVTRQNGRPDLGQRFELAILGRAVARNISRRVAVRSEGAGFGHDAVSGCIYDLVGLLSARGVGYDADGDVVALFANNERAVYADQAAVEFACGLARRKRAVFIEKRFICRKRAVGFAGFEENAVFNRRG